MKQRKTFIGLILLIAVLTLGIGYAALSNVNLEITGNAAAVPSDANFKVAFQQPSDPVIVDNGFVVTAKVTGPLTATIDVSGLKTKGDTVSATYTIENQSSELSAKLALGQVTNTNETYFKVTPELAATTLTYGQNTTVKVTVELIKTPVDNQTAQITVPITATAQVA